MSDEERARILRLVAEGKVSPEEAADLLEAIQPEPPRAPEPPAPPEEWNSGAMAPGTLRRRARFLVIHVREGGENKVNVRIPLSLTRAAGKFIPRQAQSYLGKYDINLHDFLEEVTQSEGGTLLEVRDGENKVLIAVE
jgi:hypothetical protein